MISFLKDLTGALIDNSRLSLYFLAGVVIVTVFMFLLKWLIEWILVPLLT